MAPQKPIILIIEDSDTMWYLYNDLLADDYDLRRATEGRQALRELVRAKPGLIVLDWTLDDIKPWDQETERHIRESRPRTDGDKPMSGLDVLKVIKRSALKTIPVIMLTGHSGLHEKLLGKYLRANKYLTKPLNETAFINAVHALLPPVSQFNHRLAVLAAEQGMLADGARKVRPMLQRPNVEINAHADPERQRLEAAIKMQPDNLDLRHQLYLYFVRQGMRAEANEQVREAMRLMPRQMKEAQGA